MGDRWGLLDGRFGRALGYRGLFWGAVGPRVVSGVGGGGVGMGVVGLRSVPWRVSAGDGRRSSGRRDRRIGTDVCRCRLDGVGVGKQRGAGDTGDAYADQRPRRDGGATEADTG